ncbi:hypothetical protein BDW22DRAFT_911829 [Trametopsis cervina]|nr:hypothetical protein BDW22DRAFT_911829 [Trametopsis cervina]
MTDDRSFMSVGLPTLQHQPAQDASHNNLHVQSEHTDYDQGYSHHAEDDQYKRRSSADLPYSGRSSFVTNRSSSQGYGGQMSVQLPSLNGVFHDPTRSMYVPGPSAGSPGSYGGPSPTDENNVDTFRLPLSASVAASHPHSQFDYHAHHQTDFHQDRHSSHSQASYRDHHPHIPDHSSNPSISPIVPSNPSPGPSYSHSRQHHPHSQMVSSMLYSSHPNEPSSSGFNRSFPQSGSHSYADSHSSTSLSPQLDVSPQLSPVATKVEDRSGPVASSSAARSLPVKRREKPKIELAPDQPLTTQGKPRARVYVACMQWI